MWAELEYADRPADEQARRLRALVPGGESVSREVAAIIDDVRRRGDAAVDHHTTLHDTRGGPAPPIRVTDASLQEALDQLDQDLRAGILAADVNVERVARAALRNDTLTDFGTHSVRTRELAVGRAGIYVPGGRAPYPSTVVMGVATARAAGVRSIVVTSPPDAGGEINPVVLAACALTGADEVYRMGGAQAIAALALGTETVASVDVIVGPGNLWVQEAKLQLCGRVGIDSFAGPSDLLAIADGSVPAQDLALDLLAQAEHGAATLVVAASCDRGLLEAVLELLERSNLDSGAVCRLLEVASLDYAMALAEAFAPEHLELLGPLAEQRARDVTRAGCVFIGTGTAFGDYIAGSNHTLPTGGAARFASALGVHHFRRAFNEVRVADATPLARVAAPIARAEGFELHARSMETRIRDNQA